ncbi:MAG: hypothetical protein JNN09_08780 [Alphaproteobacteria bacterium]|nr:hypothetical protein [Alphaproteobacteria bacterium]
MPNENLASERRLLRLGFWGVFVAGNLTLSILLRLSAGADAMREQYQAASFLHLGFLLFSVAFVSALLLRLKMHTFLSLFIAVVLLTCLGTTVLYGFFSPFSLFAYSIDAMLNGRSFPNFSITGNL